MATKQTAHTLHTMKQVYTTVVDVPVRSYSITKKQRRLITVYLCDCSHEEVMYREVDNPGFSITEYTKPVTATI